MFLHNFISSMSLTIVFLAFAFALYNKRFFGNFTVFILGFYITVQIINKFTDIPYCLKNNIYDIALVVASIYILKSRETRRE